MGGACCHLQLANDLRMSWFSLIQEVTATLCLLGLSNLFKIQKFKSRWLWTACSQLHAR